MFHDLINLFYPKLCGSCNAILTANETICCTKCRHALPLFNSHGNKANAVHKIFYGRVQLENATALLRFEKKGMVQQLIHNLKYRGKEEIGIFLGNWLGNELNKIDAYKTITAVAPVPLHRSKLKKRGYNQVEKFGREIAKALEVPYVDSVLVKKTATQTQTYKKRLARWGSIQETFLIENPNLLKNEHVLLVDDLVTTGATLEACVLKLFSIPGIKLSVATMAITQ